MNGKRILVTGGAGFLGSHFIKKALGAGAESVANVDVLNYAGDLRRLSGVDGDPRYSFFKADIAESEAMMDVFAEVGPEVVFHFAAESHVTRSERYPDIFFRTNITGTRCLLDAAVANGVDSFIHVSTDEVYGPVTEGSYREEDKLPGEGRATSAYARSKALADDIAMSFAGRLRVVIARSTNAFGTHQYPEKALARWVTKAIRGDKIPVWGDGRYVRQWLEADDIADAMLVLAGRGEPGQAYNVAPRHEPEITNIGLAEWLVDYLGLPRETIAFTEYDRPDHDRRYMVNSRKLESLGWSAGDVWDQLAATVEWYRANEDWWGPHLEVAESLYVDAGES